MNAERKKIIGIACLALVTLAAVRSWSSSDSVVAPEPNNAESNMIAQEAKTNEGRVESTDAQEEIISEQELTLIPLADKTPTTQSSREQANEEDILSSDSFWQTMSELHSEDLSEMDIQIEGKTSLDMESDSSRIAERSSPEESVKEPYQRDDLVAEVSNEGMGQRKYKVKQGRDVAPSEDRKKLNNNRVSIRKSQESASAPNTVKKASRKYQRFNREDATTRSNIAQESTTEEGARQNEVVRSDKKKAIASGFLGARDSFANRVQALLSKKS